MGKSHALSGGVGWLAGCALLAVAGAHPAPLTVAVGAAVSAGMALAPDVDHPQSTIAHSLGWATRALAGGVERSAAAVRTASCLHCATGRDRGGHRGITHTLVGALTAGGMVAGLSVWLGRSAALWVIGFAVWLAAHAALSSRWRARIGDVVLPGRFRNLGKGAHRFTAMVGALLVGVAAAAVADSAPPDASWWWVGLAVFWGWLAHSLGDALTYSRVPLLWPLQIRGCRWTPVGSPHWLRFRTGSRTETAVVWLMLLAGAGSLLLLGTS